MTLCARTYLVFYLNTQVSYPVRFNSYLLLMIIFVTISIIFRDADE